jgi:Flp pilus assembly protein TadG
MRSKHRGATAVELALILPLLLLVVDGVMEFSMVMYDKVILTNAAREAARAGAVIQTVKLTTAEIAEVAQSYCASYLLTFGSAPTVSVLVNQSVDPVFQTPLTVTVSFTYHSVLMSSILSALHAPIEMTSTATRWNE